MPFIARQFPFPNFQNRSVIFPPQNRALGALGMEYYKPSDLPSVSEGAIFNELGQPVTDWRVFAADTGQGALTDISQLSWAKLHYNQLPPRWVGHTYYRPSQTDATVYDETGRVVSWQEFAAATGQQAVDPAKVDWAKLNWWKSPPAAGGDSASEAAGSLTGDIATGFGYWTDFSNLPSRLFRLGSMSKGELVGFAAPVAIAAWLYFGGKGGRR